jgi:NAD(P)-dependent dehydrogenase (short-subunit alcohol dehydrogenase family)
MKKTVVITGATGSIGKATALELAKNDCNVILAGRDAAKLAAVQSEIINTTGNKDIEMVIVDLSEPKSVKRAAAEIKEKHQSLNALINIAAIFKPNRVENSEGAEYMFATNHLGPFTLTNALLDLLKAGKPARVVTVSAPSTTKVNFEDLQGKTKFSAGFMGVFGATKMMNLLFTYALARRLENTGVTASVFHPGLVKSGLTKDMPSFMNFIIQLMSGSPEKAAKMLCKVATDPAFSNANGTFINSAGKEIKSSKYSYDKEVQEKLWEESLLLSK